jgi:aspartate kinase
VLVTEMGGIAMTSGQVAGIVVLKYGGSSLASLDRMCRIAERVASDHVADGPRVVVVSARGNTTDELLAVASELGGDRASREADQLLATGECASAALMAMALAQRGVLAVSLTGVQAGIRASGKHGEGVISAIDTGRIRRLLGAGVTVVVAGFQGVNEDGDVITLGRGGSDTTAVALAAVLGASRCEIYSDVEGVCTADPRVVPTARVMTDVDVGMMAEMAFAGAKVLHSRAVELAAMHGVEVLVGSAVPQTCGTAITASTRGYSTLEGLGAVAAITHDMDVARVLVRSNGGTDVAEGVLRLLASQAVPVDLVARSGPYEAEFRMGFTVRRSDLIDVRAPLEHYVGSVSGVIRIDENVGKLSLIGMGLLNRPAYTARMLSTLAAAGIPTSWISTSQLRTSAVIPLDRLAEAVLLLHHEFGLERTT